MLPDRLELDLRPGPSANVVLLGGRVLVSLAMLQVLRADGVHERVGWMGWVVDLAALAGLTPGAVVDRLVAELTGSGALALRAGVLQPTMLFEPRD